jgi:GNAT superfamily N-acetyltransferase
MVAIHPVADIHLARRLERMEGSANRAFVESRAAVEPEVGATWIGVAGAYAMFDGVESPLTQTFGLGLFDEVGPDHVDRIESFYRERSSPVFHEVSPLAGVALFRMLHERGYQPVELTSVMYRPIAINSETSLSRIAVHAITGEHGHQWAEIAAQGWSSEAPQLVDFVRGIGRISVRAHGTTAFLATLDERPIAAAALNISDGIALLSGASTIPEARKQGAQQALLHARLRHAREHGCDLAMMCAVPGSASQRNAERHGFRIAYTRTKWQLEEASRLRGSEDAR